MSAPPYVREAAMAAAPSWRLLAPPLVAPLHCPIVLAFVLAHAEDNSAARTPCSSKQRQIALAGPSGCGAKKLALNARRVADLHVRTAFRGYKDETQAFFP